MQIHVQPKARRTEIVGPHGDALKIRVAAPPVDGRANAALCKFMAHLCQVTGAEVELRAGASGRAKRLVVRAPRQLPPGVEAPHVGR